MTHLDRQRGLNTLRADQNWKSAGFWLTLRVLLLGKRQTTIHLGKRLKLAWLDDEPYLLDIKEVRT